MAAISPEAKKKQYETQKRVHAETLDRIYLVVKKGNKKRYQDHAKSKGMSLNALIISLLEQELNN